MTIGPVNFFTQPVGAHGPHRSNPMPEQAYEPQDSVAGMAPAPRITVVKPAAKPVQGFPIDSFCFTPQGTLVSTENPNLVGAPAKVRAWSDDGGEPLMFDVARPHVRIGPVASSPGGELVAVGWDDGKFSVFSRRGSELNTQEHAPTSVPDLQGILRDNDDVRTVTFSPDGQTLATGGCDGRVLLWDPQGRMCNGTLQHPDAVLEMAFTPDNSRLVTRHRGGIAVWDVREQRLIHRLDDVSRGGTTGFALSQDGRQVAGTFGDVVKVFDVASGQELHSRPIWASSKLAFTPDGNHLLVGECNRNAVQDWNLVTGEMFRQDIPHLALGPDATGINQITVSDDGTRMGIGLKDGSLTLWSLSNHDLDQGFLADNLRVPETKLARLGNFVYTSGIRGSKT